MTPFSLATCSVGSSAPFAALAVADRVLPLTAAAAFLQRQELSLATNGSVLDLLQQWPRNFPLLQRVAAALASGAESDLVHAIMPPGELSFHPPVNLPDRSSVPARTTNNTWCSSSLPRRITKTKA